MNPDLTNLSAVLMWLATAGAPFLVLWVMSLLAENWPKWHTLPRLVKFLTPLILAPLVAVGATLLASKTQLIAQIGPWYTIVVGSILAYIGSQKALMSAKRNDYGTNYSQVALWSSPSTVLDGLAAAPPNVNETPR